MAQGDPIKYSDFVLPDDTLTDTIRQLNETNEAYTRLQDNVKGGKKLELNLAGTEGAKMAAQFDEISDAFINMQKNIEESANKLKTTLSGVNSTTVSNRKAISEMSKESQKLVKAQEALEFAISKEGEQLVALREETSQEVRMSKLRLKAANNLKDSYNALSAQYSLNKEAINSMSEAERVANKDFIEETKAIYERMSAMQKETGKSALEVGSYEESIKRALGPMSDWKTMLWQTGGDLEKLKPGLASASQGVKAFSSQLLKLLANPVVAIIAAIAVAVMVLVSAFKKVIDVAKGNEEQSVKLEKAMQPIRVITDAVTRAFEKLAEIFIVVVGWVMKAVVAFTDLMGITDDAAGATEQYIILEERKLQLLKDTRNEMVNTAKAEQEVAMLREKSVQKDKYNAQERIEFLNRAIKLEQDIAQERKKLAVERLAILEEEASFTKNSTEMEDKLAQARVEVIRIDTEMYQSTRRMLGQRAQFLATIEADAKKELKVAEERYKKLVDIQKKEIAAYRSAEDARARAMEEGFSKQHSLLNLDYTRRIEDIQFRLATERELTVDAAKSLNQEIEMLNAERARELAKLWEDFAYAESERDVNALQLKLATLKEGSLEELNARKEILEKQREQDLANNSRLATELKQDEKDINAYYNKQIADENTKFIQGAALASFEAQQALSQSEFDLLVTSEEQKTRFKLKAERERWQKILELNKTASKKMTDTEVQTVNNIIKKIDQELAKSQSREGVDLYAAVGLKLDDEQKKAIEESANFALGQLSSILQMNTQISEQALQAATARVEKAQEALDAEIEASRNGFANNTELAQKRLEDERKNQEKALNDKKKAQRAQEALDTVTQSTSLITASAEIWKSLAGIPIIGPALAVAAIGTMWATFAASKIKAKQMSKQEFGEGGLEFLNGGSHQSGNDIPIGITRDGRQRTAEGGEAMAIINKRNTSKYRSLLPDIIESLNAGTFEKVFSNKDSNMSKLNVNFKAANLTTLESGVTQLVHQGHRRVMYTDEGKVELYKNRVRNLN